METLVIINKRIPSVFAEKLKEIGDTIFLRDERIEDIVKAGGFQRLVVVGGDGTHSSAVNGVIKWKFDGELVLLPWGSGNDLCRVFGMIKRDLGFALRFIGDIEAGKYEERKFDVLEFSYNEKIRYAIVGLHIGLFASIVKESAWKNALKSVLRDFAYVPIGIKEIFMQNKSKIEIEAKKMLYNGKITTLQIANTPTTGGGFSISPQSSIFDGLMEIVGVNTGRIRALGMIDKLRRGEHIGEKDVFYYKGLKKARVYSEEGFELGYDGEYIGKVKEVKVRVLKEKVKIVVPSQRSSRHL